MAMGMESSAFFAALGAIVVIDLVLAGDNAIVIALAARALPQHLQKRAIVWGALGAIIVRSALTVVVVWLLKIPGLLLVGGLLLVWIAYRLLLPGDHDAAHPTGAAPVTVWSAMRTIVVADAVMGLDNVLGVAGAAHGSYLLVALGLAISVPIVIWGSTVLLRLVERFPALVYFGAAVLAFTAAKMIASEPALDAAIVAFPALGWLLYAFVPLVLGAGFLRNHRRLESRVHARLREFAHRRPRRAGETAEQPTSNNGGNLMLRVLVPVDGSRNAQHAVRHVMREYQSHHDLELILLNVQPAFSRHVARFVARRDREAFHRQRAEQALHEARALLDEAGIPYRTRFEVGDPARVICELASGLEVHHIVLGTARRNSLTRMLQVPLIDRVLESIRVPVEVVAGDEISKLERYGVPLGVGAALGLLWLALD